MTWIGQLIAALDGMLNKPSRSPRFRRLAGIATLAILIIAAGGAGWTIQTTLAIWAGGVAGLIITAVIASSLIAQRSLFLHVRAVVEALEQGGVAAGRNAVAQIVGRDPQQLDGAGIARAAIESLAENFSDGIVAPAFWLAIGGLPGVAAYKAINTADSMIGHRTPRHEDFGRASARFDDLVNLPASRLSGLLIVAAALFVPGASPANAWRALRRDARRHNSPNAGWPEAAMAGALGLALAGPRVYGGMLIDDVIMGEGGRREVGVDDIRHALTLFCVADALLIGALAIGAAFFMLHG